MSRTNFQQRAGPTHSASTASVTRSSCSVFPARLISSALRPGRDGRTNTERSASIVRSGGGPLAQRNADRPPDALSSATANNTPRAYCDCNALRMASHGVHA